MPSVLNDTLILVSLYLVSKQSYTTFCRLHSEASASAQPIESKAGSVSEERRSDGNRWLDPWGMSPSTFQVIQGRRAFPSEFEAGFQPSRALRSCNAVQEAPRLLATITYHTYASAPRVQVRIPNPIDEYPVSQRLRKGLRIKTIDNPSPSAGSLTRYQPSRDLSATQQIP